LPLALITSLAFRMATSVLKLKKLFVTRISRILTEGKSALCKGAML